MALGLADRLGCENLGTKLRPSVKRGYGTWVGGRGGREGWTGAAVSAVSAVSA
jgi:hypothetical protein